MDIVKTNGSIPALDMRAKACNEKLIIPDAAAPASNVSWNGALLGLVVCMACVVGMTGLDIMEDFALIRNLWVLKQANGRKLS
jgi:hypothetical protein